MVSALPCTPPQPQRYLVIDGAHRTFALKELCEEITDPEERSQFEAITVDLFKPFSAKDMVLIASTMNAKTTEYVETTFYDEYFFVRRFIDTLPDDTQRRVLDGDKLNTKFLGELLQKEGFSPEFFRTILYVSLWFFLLTT